LRRHGGSQVRSTYRSAARVQGRARNSRSVAHVITSYGRLDPGAAMARKASKRRSRATRRRAGSARSRRSSGSRTGRRWARHVTEHSDALTLQKGVFTSRDPKRIAASLKRSAQRSRRRKADPYRSALSMLTFYINRAGKNLPASRKKTLMRAKGELRKQFG